MEILDTPRLETICPRIETWKYARNMERLISENMERLISEKYGKIGYTQDENHMAKD